MSELISPATPRPPGSELTRLTDLITSGVDGETRLLHAAATGDSLSQLTVGMAHELNNLIGGISALSEIYLQGMESGLPIKDGLGLIHHSAGRLQKLLRQLTEINRRPAGERSYLNLTDMVRSELELFAHVVPRGVRFQTELSGEELAVLLDDTALRQILLNLILNLRDGMGHERATGTITVTIRRLPTLTLTPRAEIRLSAVAGENTNSSLEAGDGDGSRHLETQLRLLDAQRSVQQLGGALEVHPGGDFSLTLSLIA